MAQPSLPQRGKVQARVHFVTWAMLACATAPHLAGPPLETDDPDTPGPGRWEVNVSSTLEKRRDTREWTPLLDLNYGVGERVQLKLKPRYVVLDEPRLSERAGLGNIQAGVKWRFLDEKRHSFAMSIYPQVDLNPPGNSDARGLVEEGADFLLPMQVAKSFGQMRLYGEVGYDWREHRRGGWLFGLAFEYPLDATFRLTGEIRGGAEGDLADSELLLNVGFKARLADHVTLLGSGGRTVCEAPGQPVGVFSYFGLQFTF
jgi:hypothetical protein